MPFTYPLGRGAVISGTIDLCFPVDADRTKWVVFDWKSRVPPRGDKLHDKYREQLARYAKALLEGLGEVEVVDTQIVGPHPELGEVATADEVLLEVRGDFRARLGELLELGAPMPAVGYDVGEPAVTVELAWEERRVAIAPELSDEERAGLARQGWTVRTGIDEDIGALLGLAAPAPEDA